MLHHVLDRFLGRHHLGSLAINQILPGGREQLTHTDYPPGFYTVKVAISRYYCFLTSCLHHLKLGYLFCPQVVAIAIDSTLKSAIDARTSKSSDSDGF